MKESPKLLKGWFRKLLRRRLFIVMLLALQLFTILYYLIDQSTVSAVIGNLLKIISLLVALHIISKRTKEAYKLTWVFIILIFPVFGGIFYLLFRYQTRSKKLIRAVETLSQKTKPAYALTPSVYEKATEQTPDHARQIEYLEKYSGYPIYENTKTRHLSPGEDFWEALLPDLEKAKSYIFVESFIIENGQMWDSIYTILKQKAAQGVAVRILYDDMGCFLRLPLNFVKNMRTDGIRSATFNRFVPVLNAIQNYRDHRKIIVIDGKIAYTGGLNIADEYVNIKSPFGHWKDTGVRVEGSAAWSFTLMFLETWQFVTTKAWKSNVQIADDVKAFYPWRETPCPIQKHDSFVLPFADSPLDNEHVTDHVYTQMITKARKYVYIMTPYLIVDNSMVSALCTASKSGVDIRIITPRRFDKRIVHFTTRSYYRELIKAGIRVYEYTPGFIHSKTFVSDDDTAVIGSANMDFRSLYLQFECGVWMYRAEAVTELRDDFLKTLEVCHEMTAKECKCNVFTRFFQEICRLFAPLM